MKLTLQVIFRLLFPVVLSLNFLGCSTQPTAPVAAPPEAATEQPAPYVSRDLFPDLEAQIADFPRPGSAAQKADEAVLRKLQKTRTTKDCERAQSEAVVNLKTMHGKPYGELSDEQVAALNPFFQELMKEFGPYIGKVKNKYSRHRPYVYLKDIKPCIATEPSFAYPSGHAAVGAFSALVLSDLFPEKASLFRKRGEVIGQDRVLGGVHHPTDIESGKKMGEIVYSELAKSKRYQEKIEAYKKTLPVN